MQAGFKTVATLGIIALTWTALTLRPDDTPALAAQATDGVTVDVRSPESVAGREPTAGAPQMLATLFDVDAAGGLRARRIMLLDGEAPPSPTRPDLGRIYHWRLLGPGALQLAEGRHFDRLAVYTPRLEGGCDKSALGDHAMLLRVPYVPGAERLLVRIESTRTDMEMP